MRPRCYTYNKQVTTDRFIKIAVEPTYYIGVMTLTVTLTSMQEEMKMDVILLPDNHTMMMLGKLQLQST